MKKKETFFDGKVFNWQDMIKSLKIFNSLDDRGAAIMGYAYLDDLLNELLKLRLVKDKELFENIDDLPSRRRIDLCFLTGIISRIMREDLIVLNDIRNKFAHCLTVNSFNEEIISDKCDKLKIIEYWQNLPNNYRKDTPRNRFYSSISIHHFGFCLMLGTAKRIEELKAYQDLK